MLWLEKLKISLADGGHRLGVTAWLTVTFAALAYFWFDRRIEENWLEAVAYGAVAYFFFRLLSILLLWNPPSR